MTAAAVASVVVAGVLAGSVLAAQPLRPDLVETHVSIVQRGLSLLVTDSVANRGSVAAPASTTGYHLGGVRIGQRSVRPLRPGARSHASRTLAIPRSFAAGSYRLRVCADDRRRLPETNELDNCRAAAKLVVVADRTAPRFAGLTRATTCLPGPGGGPGRESRYVLEWNSATDDVTPASGIVYDVYEATAPGGEDFSQPTYTTAAGATSFTTSPVPDSASYYFVVRARDRAGNQDTNGVERAGVNVCL